MRNNPTPLRPGLTAIAAVLALSATPVLAQNAETAPAQDAPVIAAPAQTPAAPASDPALAPVQQSVTTENTAAPLATPAPAPMATQSTPVLHTTADSVSDAAPVAKAAAPAKARVAVTPITAAAPVAAPAPKVAAPAPTPVAPPAVAPAPVAKTTAVRSSAMTRDDNSDLELAGAGALGLILLGGGAVALSRRRRKRDDEALVLPAAVETVEPAMAPIAYETVETAPVIVAPAIAGAPTTALHEDFDLSRYGPHVQAAYRGPTEDNPSLSLRHRLKRARFMDQRARESGDPVAEPMAPAERKPIAQNLFGSKLKDGLRSLRPQPGLRPAFG